MKETIMVRDESNNRQSSILVFSMTKAEIWVMNHMINIVVGGVILGYLVFIEAYFRTHVDTARHFIVWTIASVLLISMILSLRFLVRNLCYRVEIDTANERIKLFRAFNKPVVEAPIRLVEFRVDKHLACIYNGRRFNIMNYYTYPISDVLPPGVEIQFSENFLAQFLKRQAERNRKAEMAKSRNQGGKP